MYNLSSAVHGIMFVSFLIYITLKLDHNEIPMELIIFPFYSGISMTGLAVRDTTVCMATYLI